MLTLKGFKTKPQAVPVKRATTGSACWDLTACLTNTDKIQVIDSWNETRARVVQEGQFTLFGGERALMPTGWIFDIPDNHSIRIHPRSGMSWKQGICLANAEAVIDADYTQETFVLLWNTTEMQQVINHGDRIAQMELVPVYELQFEETTTPPQPKTDRQGGFGSTGVSS